MNHPLKPLKWYKYLALPQGRRENGLFMVEGHKAVRQLVESSPGALVELVVAEDVPGIAGYESRAVTRRQYEYISSSKTPQGIMALVRLPQEAYTGHLPPKLGNRILLLEDIQDPGNLGTLVRSAAAFGFEGVVMSEKCADPFSPKCIQSAAGSVLALWLRRTDKYLALALELKQLGYRLVATSLDGGSDGSMLKPNRLVLALGNEAAGLSQQVTAMADYLYTIPIDRARAESLNVAVSGAIVMHLAAG